MNSAVDETASPCDIVVGAGGLLGSAVLRRLGPDAQRASIPWGTPEAAPALTALAEHVAATLTPETPWSVYWCAGAGVNGTAAEALAQELAEFRMFLEALIKAVGPHRGKFFLASSAGGVYAGAQNPPFTEAHETAPLSDYGSTKLAMEATARDAFRSTAHSLTIGRIANLYGPGQNLGKMQGLISHLCRALATDQPLSLFVPIDTIRDYIYVDDAADMIVSLAEVAFAQDRGETLKIISSGRGATIGELIGLTRAIAKRKPPVVYASSPLASFQSSDLRLRSTVLPELDACARTPLPTGIAATVRAVAALGHSGALR